MYAKNLIAHRGTDNQILIEFVNQDQKRVDISGMTMVCRIISHDGETLLLEKPLEMVNALAGQTKLVLTEEELDKIKPGKAGYSVEHVGGTLSRPIYVDDNAGARGVIDIVDSIMPAFVSSQILTIPDHGLSTSYTSSLLITDDSDLHTFQIEMEQYTGTIKVEGAAAVDGLWYTIQTQILTTSNLTGFTVDGFHPYIRFSIVDDITNTGSILTILYR